MGDQLAEAQQEQQHAYAVLEQRVQERTAELASAVEHSRMRSANAFARRNRSSSRRGC